MKAALALFISIFVLAPVALLAQTVESPCAKLTLKGPTGISNPGDSVEFYVEAKDPKDLDGVTFDWKIVGRSFKGQGTPRIQVSTTREDGNSSITAFVKIVDKASGCSFLLSESAGVDSAGPGPDHFWFDLGSLKTSDLKNQLDVFFAELANNPNNEGVIEITFTKDTSRQRKVARLNVIDRHILFRRFSPIRISYYLRTGDYERIRTIRMPPGSDYGYFGIDRSILIKAEEYKSKVRTIF